MTEWVILYFYLFGEVLDRLGLSAGAAYWLGAFLTGKALVSVVATFRVKSARARWILAFYALVIPLISVNEFGWRVSEALAPFH